MQRLRSITFRDVIDVLTPLCLLLVMYLAYVAVTTQGALEREVQRNEVRAEFARQEAERSTFALCALRESTKAELEDSRQRLKTTREFIEDHPQGTADFSLSLLQESLERAKTAVARQSQIVNQDLDDLECEE